jgi:hypothetical protein
MALEGSLSEFGLADILQLLYFQHKTGVLVVQGKLDKVRLLFNEGNIVGAESKKRDTASRLGRVLNRRGLISDDDLHNAMREQRKTGAKLGATLLRKGLVSLENIQEVLEFQLTETVMQLFSWKDGKYAFRPQEVPVDKDVPIVLDTQHFLMEGLRMLDEWSVIGDRVSLDSLFGRTVEAQEEMLSPEEREIIRHLDGRNDVTTIADLTGMDSFQVSKILLGLVEKGMIAKEEIIEEAPARRKERGVPGLRFLVPAMVAGALAISVLVVLPGGAVLDGFRAYEELDAMRFQLATLEAQNGSYPASLPSSLRRTDPWGNGYIYRSDGESFTLRSPGPDGVPDTGDDIY